MTLETSKSKFDLEYGKTVKCPSSVGDGEEHCEIDIVTLGDKSVKAEDKTQVYISGALHGNERIGPVVAYYLIELLVTNFEHDNWINYLLKNREIVITPMTNAVGYAHNEREES